MGILKWSYEVLGQQCQGCGDHFPKSVLVTLKGYGDSSGVYCTVCAQEAVKEEMED